MVKLCERNKIPRPGNDYWTLKKLGRFPVITLLPSPEKDWDVEIVHQKKIVEDSAENEGSAAAALEKTDKEPAVVPSLHHAHPLVRASLPSLRVSRCDLNGLLIPVPGCVHVCVSKPRLRRALLIMDALIRSLERRGFTVTCLDSSNGKCQTNATLMGVDVPFRIDEELVDKDKGSDKSIHAGEKFRPRSLRAMIPSGSLSVLIHVDRWTISGSGARVRWTDGKRQRVEEQLENVVAGAVRVAAAIKAKNDEREKREREYKAEQERKAEVERQRLAMVARIKEERKRVIDLMEEACSWQDSRILRDYIEAVRKDAWGQGKDVGSDSEIGKWLAWAEIQADRLDPLKESPSSILDEAEKYGLKESDDDMQKSGYPPEQAPYTSTSDRRAEFFQKRWLYQRFRGGR